VPYATRVEAQLLQVTRAAQKQERRGSRRKWDLRPRHWSDCYES